MQPVPDPRRWWALALLATAQFLVIMDTSIIGVALPDIQADLSFSPSDLSWVFNAYVIAFGGLLLLGGKLADLYGARRIFAIGFAGLTASSLLAGLADDTGMEITARALQGASAAMIAPTSLSMLFALFGANPRELTRALAVYGAAAPAGGTAGVFLGGVLTEWLDWPWVFYVNIPVGFVVLATMRTLLPDTPRQHGRLDVTGAILATVALSSIVYGIVRAPDEGWGTSATIAPLIGGGVLAIAFVTLQSARKEPLLPLSIFRTPNLAAANVVMALLGAAWVPMWYFLNLYVQQVLGYGPFKAGSALLPMTGLMMILMVFVTERLVSRSGIRPVLATGMTALAGGLGVLALIRPDGNFLVDVLAGSLIAAVGMSLAYIPAMLAAMSEAKPEQAGLASGIVNTSYQVGSALGLGAMTAVATSNGAGEFGDLSALTDGFSTAFAGAAGIAILGLIATVTLRRHQPTQDIPGDPDRVLVSAD